MKFLQKIAPVLFVLVLALVLRTSILSSVPATPYWEETILGFDAYSIALTGKDHHGTSWPIVGLESFGDWKPAGYVYAVAPFIRLFGLELWVVRLPSLLAGLALIAGITVLARRLQLSMLATALLVTVSPWAIHFSRAAWEAHLATALITWAIIFAFTAIKPKRIELWPLMASVCLFVAAWYTYHAARLVVPLLGIGLIGYGVTSIYQQAKSQKTGFIKYLRQYSTASRYAILFCVLLLALAVSPLLLMDSSRAISQRFNETGRFTDPEVVLQSNELKEIGQNSVIARLLYHRYLLWSSELFTALVDNLDPSFLFLRGESHLRHTTPTFGLFFPFELLFVLIGVYQWVRKRDLLRSFLWYWLFIGLIPAVIATPTPHSLRMMTAVPVLSLLIIEGVATVYWWLIGKFSKSAKYLVISGFVVLYAVSTALFWYNYTTIYSVLSSRHWQFGYQEMYQAVFSISNDNPSLPIFISRSEGRPAAYLWFYQKTQPQLVQALNDSVKKDQGEYLTFDIFNFVGSPGEIPDSPAIVVLTKSEFDNYRMNHTIAEVRTITAPDGSIVWKIGIQQ